MSKNLIPVIAKELGVKIGEDFNVTGYAKTIRFKFEETGLLWIDECEKIWTYTDLSTFFRLIDGDVEIIKLPFNPVLHEEYWTYDRNWNFVTVAWSNNFFDYIALKNGCVFRTHQEAHDARMTKYKELTGRSGKNE